MFGNPYGLGMLPIKPGSACIPMPGIEAAVVTMAGEPCGADEKGIMVIKRPFPGLIATLWGEKERYGTDYWSKIPGLYYTGDSAHIDEDGRYTDASRLALSASFQQVVDAQLAAALVDRRVAGLVAHHRCACDDAQALRVEPSELGNHLLGKPVGEVLLIRIAREKHQPGFPGQGAIGVSCDYDHRYLSVQGMRQFHQFEDLPGFAGIGQNQEYIVLPDNPQIPVLRFAGMEKKC